MVPSVLMIVGFIRGTANQAAFPVKTETRSEADKSLPKKIRIRPGKVSSKTHVGINLRPS